MIFQMVSILMNKLWNSLPTFYFGWKRVAGLVAISFELFSFDVVLHLAVQWSYWSWGYSVGVYDAVDYHSFSCGPIFILSWSKN